jgi:hypothetical protein
MTFRPGPDLRSARGRNTSRSLPADPDPDVFESTPLAPSGWYDDGQHGGGGIGPYDTGHRNGSGVDSNGLSPVTVELFREVPVALFEGQQGSDPTR